MTKFIAIDSGKGGVGKTTTAINLGNALSNMGKETLVLDGNLTTPNIGVYLGFANPPASVHSVMEGTHTIRDATYVHASGTKFMPGSININALQKIDLNKVKNLHKKLKGCFESVLIDTGSGITPETLTLMNIADEILVVTNPELAAVTDALRTIKKAEQQGKTILGVVLNKISEESEMSIENVESVLGVPIIAAIPESIEVRQSRTMKHPVVYLNPASDVAAEFNKLAEKLK